MKLKNTLMAPYDNIDRKTLIQKYLNAETSVEEERLLAESFADNPPKDEEEKRVAAVIAFSLGFISDQDAEGSDTLQDADDEFDRIINQGDNNGKGKDSKTAIFRKRNRIRVWGLSLSGLAAAVAMFFLLRPQTAELQHENNPVKMIEQVQLLSQTALENAEKCEFEPIEGGYILTAHFPDGSEGKYLLTVKEEDQSYFLISLNTPAGEIR